MMARSLFGAAGLLLLVVAIGLSLAFGGDPSWQVLFPSSVPGAAHSPQLPTESLHSRVAPGQPTTGAAA